MKKINLLIAFLGLLLCSYNAMADLTVAVSVTSVQVTGMCDLDGFGAGDSDPQWDIDVSDNRDYSEAFDHELTSNGPSITVSSGYDNSLTFSKAYTGVCPPNFLTVDWSGYEDDIIPEVRFDEVYQWAVPTTAGTYTLTRSGTASGCSGTITWTINLQMVVTGTLNYICSDTPCAASVQSLQDPCVTALNYTFYDVSSSTQTFSDASTSCAYDGNKDIFFQLQAPTSGAFTLWVGNWDDWGASTLSDLTGNLYTGSSCSSLSIVSQNIIDGQGQNQNTDCIDFSSGLLNGTNEGPFSVTGLTPGATYYLRVSEEDDQPANVTLAFAEKAIEDNCVTAQPLTGDGCNYNAVGGDFNTPYDVGASPYCGWSSMDNSVFYSFSVTASTPQPVSVTVENINCDNTGGGTLQLGIWKKPAGICTTVALQSLSNYVACASGTGTVTVNGGTLPVGDYLLVADGNAGAQCRWNFESVALLSCSVTAVDANIGTTCNDNGTPTDATDDYYVATVTVTYNNPPATGNLVLSGSAIAASTPAANLTQAVGSLAAPAVFNNIRIKAGVTNQTITATFSADGACTFSNNAISSSAACAASCPAAPMVSNDTGASCSGGTDDFAAWQTGRSNAVAAVDNASTVSAVEYSTALPTAAVPATGNTTVTGTNVTCGVTTQTITAYMRCDNGTAGDATDDVWTAIGTYTLTVYPAASGFTVNPVMGSCGVAASAQLRCGGNTIATETGTVPTCAAPSQPLSGSFTAAEIAAAIGGGATASCYTDLTYGPIAATCAATPTATVTATEDICVTGTGTSTLDLSTLVTAGNTGGTWSLVTANGATLSGSTLDAGTAVDGATVTVRYEIAATADCPANTYDAAIAVADCTAPTAAVAADIADPCYCVTVPILNTSNVVTTPGVLGDVMVITTNPVNTSVVWNVVAGANTTITSGATAVHVGGGEYHIDLTYIDNGTGWAVTATPAAPNAGLGVQNGAGGTSCTYTLGSFSNPTAMACSALTVSGATPTGGTYNPASIAAPAPGSAATTVALTYTYDAFPAVGINPACPLTLNATATIPACPVGCAASSTMQWEH